jgi:predicted dehydrogenase
MIRFAIIGCGLIGHKRAKALSTLSDQASLIACVDTNRQRAQSFASEFNCIAFDNHSEMLAKANPDAIIIATTHEALSRIGKVVIQAGKHLFLEKPAGKNSNEIKSLIALSEKSKIIVRVGCNHRYHRACQQLKKLIDQGEIGDLMYIRGRYGHGGRLGYETEWRANPELSGGGELIDQGIHLIDLSRWVLGDFTEAEGFSNTYFWEMKVEDNGFMLLKTKKKQVAFLHASCTEWKNIFSFEVFGKKGKLHVNGLGGSYGLETLTHHKMLPQMGPPETNVYEYPMEDNSWALELDQFISDIIDFHQSSPNLYDAFQAMVIVEKIYKQSLRDKNHD